MDNKQTNYWLVLATVISLLFTGYLWLMPGSLVKPVAEWASALGTVAAVVVSLWLQFRNENRVKKEKELDIVRSFLDQLANIDMLISETINVLSDEYNYLDRITNRDAETSNLMLESRRRIREAKKKLSQLYNNNWQLNYMTSEIMNRTEQREFFAIKEKVYNSVILEIMKIDSEEKLAVFVTKSNFYEVVNEMRQFILTRFY